MNIKNFLRPTKEKILVVLILLILAIGVELISKVVEDNTPFSEHNNISFREKLPYIITTLVSALFWFGGSPVNYIYDYGFLHTYKLMQYLWIDLIKTILWWYLISCIIIYFKEKKRILFKGRK